MPPEQKERYIKLLAQGIQKESDPLVRCEILRTLAALPSPTSLAILTAGVKDPDSQVRMTACEMLGKQHDAGAVARLSEALTSDTDGDVRLAAAKALGESHDPAAVPALGHALEDKDPAMQRRAVLSLQAVTGKDYGNDVSRWRAYVHNEPVPPDATPSLAERFQQLF
jgi:HEAT repeat protein